MADGDGDGVDTTKLDQAVSDQTTAHDAADDADAAVDEAAAEVKGDAAEAAAKADAATKQDD